MDFQNVTSARGLCKPYSKVPPKIIATYHADLTLTFSEMMENELWGSIPLKLLLALKFCIELLAVLFGHMCGQKVRRNFICLSLHGLNVASTATGWTGISLGVGTDVDLLMHLLRLSNSGLFK